MPQVFGELSKLAKIKQIGLSEEQRPFASRDHYLSSSFIRYLSDNVNFKLFKLSILFNIWNLSIMINLLQKCPSLPEKLILWHVSICNIL